MQPIQLFDPASSTYTYVLFDEASREALIIDPVDEQLQRDLAVLKEHGLTLRWSVETHAHADHVTIMLDAPEWPGSSKEDEIKNLRLVAEIVTCVDDLSAADAYYRDATRAIVRYGGSL